MSYIKGVLSVERVIRPNAVEDLLCLNPEDKSGKIIFDLEDSMVRAGMCEFIKQAKQKGSEVFFEDNGRFLIPLSMRESFSYFQDMYGINPDILQGVELLKKQQKSSSGKGNADEGSEMKKIDPPKQEQTPKKKKVSKKLVSRELNIIPAGITYVAADSPLKGSPGNPGSSTPPKAPSRSSAAFGRQTLKTCGFSLGKSSSAIRFSSGPSLGFNRR